MNDWLEMSFVFGLTFLGLFFVLYTGQSTLKFNNKTLKQTIDDWWFRVVTKPRGDEQ